MSELCPSRRSEGYEVRDAEDPPLQGNFGRYGFTAAPGSDQLWQRVRDRRCAGRNRSENRKRAGQETRPYGGPGKYTPQKTGGRV